MEYPNTEDRPVRLSAVVDNPGTRYVILDFWATWCMPCVESIPMLKEVYARYHDKGLEIYSISQDSKVKEWKNFVEKNEMTWINVLANDGKASKDYGIEFIPRVFLIDCRTGENWSTKATRTWTPSFPTYFPDYSAAPNYSSTGCARRQSLAENLANI